MKDVNDNKKKILFLTWPAGEYPDEIRNAMINEGAEVDMYYSSPSKNFLMNRFLEKFPSLKKKYYEKIIDSVKKTKYDYVIMINAGIFPEYFISKISKLCKKSIRILYSWDSIEVYPSALKMHKYFDRIYSFDSEDVKQYPYINFLPLFYCNGANYKRNCKPQFDFSFVGFAHTERYKFLKKIKFFAEKNNYKCNFKLYLPSLIHYFRGKYLKKLFPDAKIEDFIFKQLSLKEVQNITNNSRIVVDLELKTQSGLTMRTIETHGLKKKFITTNVHIKEYDFYDENNILVVDRTNPVINKDFLKTDYKVLENELYTKYSLKHWVQTLLYDKMAMPYKILNKK